MRPAVRSAGPNIPMRISNHSRQFVLAVSLSSAASFYGCGGKEPAPLSERAGEKLSDLPLDQQIEQKLDPLTKEDVEIYLKVMRAAAERVKHLTPADQAALDGATKILAGRVSGRVPPRDDVKTLERANLVAISMDQIVAEEMSLDGRTYRGIVEAVESVVPNPASAAAVNDRGATAPDPTPTQLEKRLSDVNAANETFLAPRRAEIQQLIAIVRNPANLPK
jgi:hypothetical protein